MTNISGTSRVQPCQAAARTLLACVLFFHPGIRCPFLCCDQRHSVFCQVHWPAIWNFTGVSHAYLIYFAMNLPKWQGCGRTSPKFQLWFSTGWKELELNQVMLTMNYIPLGSSLFGIRSAGQFSHSRTQEDICKQFLCYNPYLYL